ncbi:MAG: hypothetical protein KGZ40_08685 [Clostridiales bacterium]|nr:hypothetical protein [Clostridiales bacterium]
MFTRILALVLALSLALVLVGCAAADRSSDVQNGAVDTPGTELRLAPGLYDLEGGTVQAIGTLTWVDLEGGFWAVVDTTGAEDTNVAVIANADEVANVLAPLEGRQVSVVGERFEGMSIRMAGPEVIAETIEEIDDTTGAAE